MLALAADSVHLRERSAVCLFLLAEQAAEALDDDSDDGVHQRQGSDAEVEAEDDQKP